MKKKIAILGSTGSIGRSVLNLINNNDFEIIFLTGDKNYKRLIKQAKKYNVKNIIITNDISYLKALSVNKNSIKLILKLSIRDKSMKLIYK